MASEIKVSMKQGYVIEFFYTVKNRTHLQPLTLTGYLRRPKRKYEHSELLIRFSYVEKSCFISENLLYTIVLLCSL